MRGGEPQTIVPLDAQGAPDPQLFIRACGGYRHISPEDWRAWDAAVARWQIERRTRYVP